MLRPIAAAAASLMRKAQETVYCKATDLGGGRPATPRREGAFPSSYPLARETAPFGVTVNVLASGLMLTSMTAEKCLAAPERYFSRVSLGRFGEVEKAATAS